MTQERVKLELQVIYGTTHNIFTTNSAMWGLLRLTPNIWSQPEWAPHGQSCYRGHFLLINRSIPVVLSIPNCTHSGHLNHPVYYCTDNLIGYQILAKISDFQSPCKVHLVGMSSTDFAVTAVTCVHEDMLGIILSHLTTPWRPASSDYPFSLTVEIVCHMHWPEGV